MTPRQKGRLYGLGQRMSVHIPFAKFSRQDKSQKVTKAEASILISMLEDGVHPSPGYISALGRSSIPVSTSCLATILQGFETEVVQYERPQHPRQWQDPYGPPTKIQLDWLTSLISMMGIPGEVMLQTLGWVTIGHASLLIKRIREFNEERQMGYPLQGGMVLFQRALDYAQDELPFLEEDEDVVKHEEIVKLEDASAACFAIPECSLAANVVIKSETWAI